MAIRKFEAGRIITLDLDHYIGTEGTIFYDEFTAEMRLSDGVTPGGIPIYNGGGGGGAGPRGPSGPSGPSGARGAQGNSGPSGPSGAKGPQGPSGPIGPSGAQGNPGARGADGVTGPTGASGPSGTRGADGVTGPSGPGGASGPSGTRGLDGATGPSGADGVTGPTGASGPSGTRGLDGATGPSGPSGAKGDPGANLIKTFNILNEFEAPLIGTSIFVPTYPDAIRAIQLVNGQPVMEQLLVGLYRNNEFLNFFSIPSGEFTAKYSGFEYRITPGDYITVNVVGGRGLNFNMALLNSV